MSIGKKIIAIMLVVSMMAGEMAEAHTVPGVDEPYDPANYYSRESISYPDSAPSPFALKELMQGMVYDIPGDG